MIVYLNRAPTNGLFLFAIKQESLDYVTIGKSQNKIERLLFIREPVVMLLLRVVLLVEFLSHSADPLRSFPQREALCVVTQMGSFPIENLPHVARVARVETYPRVVR